jgi:rhodanese-related sulfurtransferase
MKMKFLLPLLALVFSLLGCGPSQAEESLKAAAQRIADGKAVLVDVREPSEWAETGVAGPAQLLSLSSFKSGSAEWRSFLQQHRNTEIIVMCRSGNRSGQLCKALTEQGLKTTNLGGFAAWKNAGLPTRSAGK